MCNKNVFLDKDAQPHLGVNFLRNQQKAFCSLKGLLTGIICDKKLEFEELVFLNAWLKDNQF